MSKPKKATALRRVKAAYEKPESGEWVQPILKGYRMACCDRGLVHLMNFRVHKGRPQFAVWRANPSTAAMRRATIHPFLPKTMAEEIAGRLMKKTGAKQVKSHGYVIRLKK